MAHLQATFSSSRASPADTQTEDVSISSSGTDDTVESGSFASSSVSAIANAIVQKHAEVALPDKIEYDDGQSTDITPDMLRECVRKEGSHDDLSRLLCADLSGRKISLINRLGGCRMLRTLDLSYNRIASTRGLDSLYQLRDLRLTCNKLTSIFEINKLTALEHLHLQVNAIAEINKQSLRDNKKLRTLRLDGNALQKLQSLDGQVVLQQFDASQNQLTKIEGLGMMGQLEVLSLAFNQIQKIEGLHAMGRLRELDLSNNSIGFISNLKQCGQLEILRLNDNQIQSLDGLTHKLPNLVELYLNNNQLHSATAHILKLCPGLEFLALAGNQISTLAEIKSMEGLTSLIDLRLADNPICAYKGYDEHVRLYLSHVDSLDDEDVRGTRALTDATSRESADADDKHKRTLVSVLQVCEEDSGLTDQVLDRGGVTFGRARDFGAKELAEVVPIVEFEDQLRGIRDGISGLRQDLHDSMYALMFPPEKDKAAERREEEARRREEVEREERMAGRAAELAAAAAAAGMESYSQGNAAVAAALQRRQRPRVQGPSLREMIESKRAKEEASRRNAGYNAPQQQEPDDNGQDAGQQEEEQQRTSEAPPGPSRVPAVAVAVAVEVEVDEGVGVKAEMGAELTAAAGVAEAGTKMAISDLPEAMQSMRAVLDQRLAATKELLQEEVERDAGDKDALSPCHPAPASPTPFPTKEQRDEYHRAVEAREEADARAHTAASEARRRVEEQQHAAFLEQLVRAPEPDKPSTPLLQPDSPPTNRGPSACLSTTKERPAPDAERVSTPSKGEYLTRTPSKDLLSRSIETLRQSQCRSSDGLRRHTAAEAEMISFDYEKSTLLERPGSASPLRRRAHSARPLTRGATAASLADAVGGEDGGVDAMRESLSSRASKRLAEAIHYSATQSPASSPRSACSSLRGDGDDDDHVLFDDLQVGERLGADVCE